MRFLLWLRCEPPFLRDQTQKRAVVYGLVDRAKGTGRRKASRTLRPKRRQGVYCGHKKTAMLWWVAVTSASGFGRPSPADVFCACVCIFALFRWGCQWANGRPSHARAYGGRCSFLFRYGFWVVCCRKIAYAVNPTLLLMVKEKRAWRLLWFGLRGSPDRLTDPTGGAPFAGLVVVRSWDDHPIIVLTTDPLRLIMLSSTVSPSADFMKSPIRFLSITLTTFNRVSPALSVVAGAGPGTMPPWASR